MGIPGQFYRSEFKDALRHIRGVLEHVRMTYEQSGTLPPAEDVLRICSRAVPC